MNEDVSEISPIYGAFLPLAAAIGGYKRQWVEQSGDRQCATPSEEACQACF